MNVIRKEMTGVRNEISLILKYIREKEEKFIMVRKENERLEKELEDRLASAWW